MVNNAISRNEFADVILHINLEVFGQVAQAQVPLLIVPNDDFGLGSLFRVLAYPAPDLFVGGAGGDERAEFVVVNLRKL